MRSKWTNIGIHNDLQIDSARWQNENIEMDRSIYVHLHSNIDSILQTQHPHSILTASSHLQVTPFTIPKTLPTATHKPQ